MSTKRHAKPGPDVFAPLRRKALLNVGILIFPEMDQIDFTGPFEILARTPGVEVHVIGTEIGPFRDLSGLILTPTVSLPDAPELDLLLVPGGPGQEPQMTNGPVLAFIRNHFAAGKPLFSVCTGALICGAAGILQGRRVTTHWAALELLPYFGAIAVQDRVVLDGNLISAAGVTAGLDGALRVSALLRGEDAAQQIQLDIQYAPEPPFNAGLPVTAPPGVLAAVVDMHRSLAERRLNTARAVSLGLGIAHLPNGQENHEDDS